MQIKRIIKGQWYQTKQGIGKCLSTSGKHLKFEIDKKEVWLSSSDVQHEIAKGEEPKSEYQEDERPRSAAQASAETLSQRKREPGKEESTVTRKQQTDAAYIAHLEAVNAELRDALEKVAIWIPQWMEGMEVESVLKDIATAIAKAKGQTP